MQSKIGLARMYGERIGHLSRHGQMALLHKELEELGRAMNGGADAYAFRKSFLGAGGTEEHWYTYVEPAVATGDAPVLEPTAAVAVDEAEADRLWQDLAGVSARADEAGLKESVERPADAVHDPWALRPAETVRVSDQCALHLCEIAPRVLGIRVEGVFGGGEHGGARLTEEVRGAIQGGRSAVLLDLSGVTGLRIDSSGPLVSCQVSVSRVQGQFALVMPPGAAGGLIEATGLRDRMACFEDLAAALAHVALAGRGEPLP
ncbi:MAG: STAS domain-containing protein [Armatimonadota bacterium]